MTEGDKYYAYAGRKLGIESEKKTGKNGAASASHKRKPAGEKDPPQAERLLDYVGGIELFHTSGGKGYATFEQDGVYKTAALSSSTVTDLLRYAFYTAEGRPPSSQALQDARDVLKARARFDGPEQQVFVRVAGVEGRIFIDLCDDRWQMVEIGPDRWRVIDAPEAPIRFRRPAGMKALPVPERGGSLDLLKRHVPVKDDDAFTLLVAFLVGSLRPDGPYPALELTGEQGSGKTTVSRMIRALLDPSHVPVRTRPREERDLIISAENGWVLSFDNLSGLPNWLSDAFCRLATGGGFSTRSLYSNREEELFYATRPLVLNGIDDITTRGDLADRAITLRLAAIPEGQRKTEAKLWRAFNLDRPAILGALFDALSVALYREADVQLDRLPRMADFARFVVAAEPSLPIPEGAFMAAYDANRSSAREDAVANDTVASAIVDMMEISGEWSGLTSELLEELKQYLTDPSKPPRDYPSSYQAMGAHLRRIMPQLRGVGIERTDGLGPKGREFRLSKITPANEAEAAESAEKQPKNDRNADSDSASSFYSSRRQRKTAEEQRNENLPKNATNADYSAASAYSASFRPKSNSLPGPF